MIYQKDRSFDDNNYLVLDQTRQRAQFTAQSPLEFTYMNEYHYDADYRLDYFWISRWDLLLRKWMPRQKTVYEYDANQVLNKEITYKSDGVTPLYRHLYLAYNEPPYETVTKERIRQDWTAVSQEFKDAYLNYAEYFDLQDGRVLLHQKAKEYIPTNPDPWSLSIESHTYYLKSQLNSAGIPAKAADCLLPNPYRLHTPVQCPELDANTRYLLQLVNMAGQVVYTRYFCGDTGWDVDRPLPAGMYAAAISTRGKLVSTHKLMIAE